MLSPTLQAFSPFPQTHSWWVPWPRKNNPSSATTISSPTSSPIRASRSRRPCCPASSGAAKKGTRASIRDPSLGTWYDVPEDDIVHSAPIANSKLGGSHVWIKADAQIKPGSAAATAAAAQPAVAITPQPTPATHCFICPPPHRRRQRSARSPWSARRNMTPATICTLQPDAGVDVHHLPAEHGCTDVHGPDAAKMTGMLANPAARLAALPHMPDRVYAIRLPGPHTAATVCTQPLGCTFVGCTPHCPGGGPGGPFTPATLCTQHPPCPLPFTPATICPTVRCGVFNPFG